MPFQPVANCTMCEIRYQVNTNLCEITQAFYWAGVPPDQSELDALAQAVGLGVAGKMRSLMATNVNFREVYCKNLNAPGSLQGLFIFPNGTNGQRAGSPVALNEASGIIKRTAFTGRSRRGRNSISGFVEGDVDGNTLSNGLMQLLLDLAIEMLVARVGGRFLPAVASKVLGNAAPLIAAAVIDSNIDSQKTRLNAHGD
jgi:hypothetical protein